MLDDVINDVTKSGSTIRAGEEPFWKKMRTDWQTDKPVGDVARVHRKYLWSVELSAGFGHVILIAPP